MSNSSLGHKELKIQLHEIHTMFRSWDRGQINKMSLTFFTGGQIFKLVRFQQKWAQINWITKMIQKKYSLHIWEVRKYVNQGVKGQCPYMVCGRWTLTPLLTKMGTLKVYETIHFLNLHGNLINLSPFSLKSDELENLTPVQRSMTFSCFDLYLENETLYEFI